MIALADHVRWVLDHEIRAARSTRTYPAQVAMHVGRHFGPAEPSVSDVAAVLGAMGFPSSPFTFGVGRKSVTVPMFTIGSAA